MNEGYSTKYWQLEKALEGNTQEKVNALNNFLRHNTRYHIVFEFNSAFGCVRLGFYENVEWNKWKIESGDAIKTWWGTNLDNRLNVCIRWIIHNEK